MVNNVISVVNYVIVFGLLKKLLLVFGMIFIVIVMDDCLFFLFVVFMRVSSFVLFLKCFRDFVVVNSLLLLMLKY